MTNSAQVHGYPPGELREYQAETNPSVRVWIRTPTEGEKRRIASRGEVVRFDLEGRVNDPGLVELDRVVARQERFVREFVEKVTGYKDAAGTPITDGNALCEHGDTEVVAEVALEIEHGFSLGVDEAKKSDASPDS